MGKRSENYIFTGVQRDVSASKHPAQFLYNGRNIRLTARKHSTSMSITNEKGTSPFKDENGNQISIKGQYLGHCLVNNYLVVFSTISGEDSGDAKSMGYKPPYVDYFTDRNHDTDSISDWEQKGSNQGTSSSSDSSDNTDTSSGTDENNNENKDSTSENNKDDNNTSGNDTDNNTNNSSTKEGPDYITRIDLSSGDWIILYNGNLNFSLENPIEAIASYESALIQKVYWTDNRNQPRLINITEDRLSKRATEEDPNYPYVTPEWFDFVPTLKLEEKVTVKKIVGANGMFPPGVIQYAFTYYRNHGQESCIFYTTPLYYVSHKDRGGSPEDKIDNAFRITVENVDTNFDYLRIYSIQRTSLDATPYCKRIQDISLEGLNTVSYLDTGISGNTVDPTELLYKGGEVIKAGTIEQKDNTLFLGNIEIIREQLVNVISNMEIKVTDESEPLTTETKKVYDSSKHKLVYGVTLTEGAKSVKGTSIETIEGYTYINQLTFENENEQYFPCSGFKAGNIYRCGIQFQYKTGMWSDPVYIQDFTIKRSVRYEEDSSLQCIPTIQYTINEDFAGKLKQEGYLKARPVVVLPNINDRIVLCQGVVCPTLYTKNNRENYRTLLAQSSWFFRPYTEKGNKKNLVDSKGTVSPIGTFGGYSGTIDNNVSLPYAYNSNTYNPQGGKNKDSLIEDSYNIRQVEVQGDFDVEDYFKIDWNVLTLHSPDLDFDTTLYSTDFTNTGYCLVGYAKFLSTLSDIDIQTDTPTASNVGGGFIRKSFVGDNSFGIVSGLFYEDYIVDDANKDFEVWSKERSAVQWMVYPWQRTGSLNNDVQRPANKGTATATLRKKVISNLRYAKTYFFKNAQEQIGDYGKSLNDLVVNEFSGSIPQIFQSNEVSIVKLNHDIEGITTKIYQGNIDTALVPTTAMGLYGAVKDTEPIASEDSDQETLKKLYDWESNSSNIIIKELKGENNEASFTSNILWKTGGVETNSGGSELGLYRFYAKNVKSVSDAPTHTSSYIYTIDSELEESDCGMWRKIDSDLGDDYYSLVVNKDPVRMKYKSTPHIVGYFKEDVTSFVAQDDPYIVKKNDREQVTKYDKNYTLPIVEIRRIIPDENSTDNEYFKNNLFGGTSLDALRENEWIPCGYPISLTPSIPKEGVKSVIRGLYSWGDTYYQRYDCLKTYPFTREDLNQIVEIGSFMLETYVNIDGRYDRNRGQLSNINMSPQNFNLHNPVYSQKDNFFNYKIKNDDYYSNTSYPNQVTWTKEKQIGAEIDLWTNLTLSSTQELDGSKGKITSLNTFENNIFCFQDKGISNILFNSRVQIPVSEGVPIEISNSYKVDGYTYISDGIGCSNPRLIEETPAGIYFVDSTAGHLRYVGKGVSDISETCNMAVLFKYVLNSNTPFKKLVYDDTNSDLYIVADNQSLCFSEKISQFTGFYDYNDVSLIETYLSDVFVMSNNGKLWKMFEGDYCSIFGKNYPWEFTFISNGISNNSSLVDKIFTNLEFRADVEGDINYIDEKVKESTTRTFSTFISPLDYFEVWDEYQHGYMNLQNIKGTSANKHPNEGTSSLNRKFRIWRCDIPRNNAVLDSARKTSNNSESEEQGVKYPYSLDADLGISRYERKPNDRMRNPWLYIKLGKKAADENSNLHRTEIHDMQVSYFV